MNRTNSILFPDILELTYQPPWLVYNNIAEKFSQTIFLDSASNYHASSEFSYIAWAPIHIIKYQNGKLWVDDNLQENSCPWDGLQTLLNKYNMHPNPYCSVKLQGGALGYMGYELNHTLETLPVRSESSQMPDMLFGIFTTILAFDIKTKRTWCISCGGMSPETFGDKLAIKDNFSWIRSLWNNLQAVQLITKPLCTAKEIYAYDTKQSYEDKVNKTIDYIYEGDIFQANISQKFKICNFQYEQVLAYYQRLRTFNPSPFAACLRMYPWSIACASPERFLAINNNEIIASPIKGTRPRSIDRIIDEQYKHDLLMSKKDRAENIMIVDLLRNDLSKVCESNSIIVPNLCELQSFPTVHHLVSIIKGKLATEFLPLSAIKNSFPCGSISGVPKVRAMTIIQDLEKFARGPFCGALGYFSFTGAVDTAVIIRSAYYANNSLEFYVGAGIVADSKAQDEYLETLDKAKALVHALTWK